MKLGIYLWYHRSIRHWLVVIGDTVQLLRNRRKLYLWLRSSVEEPGDDCCQSCEICSDLRFVGFSYHSRLVQLETMLSIVIKSAFQQYTFMYITFAYKQVLKLQSMNPLPHYILVHWYVSMMLIYIFNGDVNQKFFSKGLHNLKISLSLHCIKLKIKKRQLSTC